MNTIEQQYRHPTKPKLAIVRNINPNTTTTGDKPMGMGDRLRWAWSQKTGRASSKSVLVALAEHANKDLLAWPSIAHLVELTEANRKTIINALSHLQESGFISDSGVRKGITGQVIAYKVHADQEKSTESGTGVTVPKAELFLHNNNPNSTDFTRKESQKRDTEPFFNPKEKDTYQNDTPPKKKNSAAALTVNPDDVKNAFNEMLPSLPAVMKLSDARKKSVAARSKDGLKTLGDWKNYFLKVKQSDFLMGNSGDRNWSATFDWLCKPANCIKVQEDVYKNRADAKLAGVAKLVMPNFDLTDGGTAAQKWAVSQGFRKANSGENGFNYVAALRILVKERNS